MTNTRKRVVITRRIFDELVVAVRNEFEAVVRTALAGGRPPSLLNPDAFDKQRQP